MKQIFHKANTENSLSLIDAKVTNLLLKDTGLLREDSSDSMIDYGGSNRLVKELHFGTANNKMKKAEESTQIVPKLKIIRNIVDNSQEYREKDQIQTLEDRPLDIIRINHRSLKLEEKKISIKNNESSREDTLLLKTLKDKDGASLIDSKLEKRSFNEFMTHQCTDDIESKDINNESDISYDQSQNYLLNENFSNLRLFMKKMFLFKLDSHSIDNFSIEEIVLLSSILKKKFEINLQTQNVYPLSEFNLVYNQKVTKRPEECYKFIFKHTFKQLKKKFLSKHPQHTSIKSQQFNLKFYNYYFSEAAQTTKLSLKNFFLPLSPEAQQLNKYSVVSKTINGWYITLIAQSPEFMKQLTSYINDDLLQNYRNQIETKIDRLCNKWEKTYLESFENYRIIEAIDESISKSIRCKLPWTVKEVEFAIETVNKLIEKYKGKSLSKVRSAGLITEDNELVE